MPHSRSELFEPFEPITHAVDLRPESIEPFEPFAGPPRQPSFRPSAGSPVASSIAPLVSPIAPVVSPSHSSMVVPCDDACPHGDGQPSGGMEDERFAVAPRGGRAKRRLKAFVVDFLKEPSSGPQAKQDVALAAAICAH